MGDLAEVTMPAVEPARILHGLDALGAQHIREPDRVCHDIPPRCVDLPVDYSG
jgi:hypothetical protein